MNQKKLDTYNQAGKEGEETDEATDKNNYETDIYDLKIKSKALDQKIEDKRHKDISVTEHHLKLDQFATTFLYTLYQYPMSASEITKHDEIQEKANSLVETIKENIEEEKFNDFIEGNDDLDNDLLQQSSQDCCTHIIRDLFPESSVNSPVRFQHE